MKSLIDANILLDVLADRQPFASESSIVWKLCETGRAEGIVSALTFANLVYVMRKELDPDATAELYKKLGLIFSFTDFSAKDLETAAELRWDDFEDAAQCAAAMREGADCIVTRNPRDFGNELAVLTPAEFIRKVMAE